MIRQDPEPKLQVGGTLNPRRHIYIERQADAELLRLLLAGEYCNVLTSRQMGKSSLMAKTALELADRDVRFVVIDVAGELGGTADPEPWYLGLVEKIARDLDLGIEVEPWWQGISPGTSNQKLLRFFREEVAVRIDRPVVIFLDEIDSTLKLPFTDDLFAAIRTMYNERPFVAAYERITFCLLGVATPNELIKDRRTTPYNIGRTLELRDFDEAQDDLSPLYRVLSDDVESGREILRQIVYWTAGHPYLTLKFCDELRNKPEADVNVDSYVQVSFADLDKLNSDFHFQQILRFFETRITDGSRTLRLYQRILSGKPETDQPVLSHAQLKLSGLVKRDSLGWLVVRNRLYEGLFNTDWVLSTKAKPAVWAQTGRSLGTRNLRKEIFFAILAVVLLAIGGEWATFRHFVPAAKARPTVAVVGFRNFQNDPEREWLATALPEMIATELAAGENLGMIPRESIARMTRELALPPAGSFARDTLEKIRRNLGTDYVVGGSFLAQQQGEGNRLRLSLHLQETRNGEVLLDTAVEGSETELFELVSRAGEVLRRRLGVGGISDLQSAAVRAAMSAHPEATQLYSVGLARLRSYDAVGAREALREAVAIDPDYALAHAALSDAWSALGYDREARESALRASELSEGLPREQVLLIQGRYFEASGQWQEAVNTYQLLWGFFPDNVDHGLRLAAAQDRAGHGEDSLATVAALRQLSPPAGDDPRIDLVEARTADRLSANHRQLEAAQRAVEKGEARQAWILVAEARYYQGRALRRLGEIAAATAALREAEEKFQQAGDRGMMARSLFQMGIMHHHRGDLVRAEDQYRQALAILREIGNERLISGMLNILATVVRLQGRLAQAEAIVAEVPEHARRCGDRLEEAQAMDTLAVVLLARGEFAAAEKLDRAALTIAEEYGDQTMSAWIHFDLGKIFFAAGDLTRARTSYEKAQQICEEIEYRHLSGHVFHGLGNLLLVQGDLDGAGKMFDASAAIRRELDEKGYLAEVDLSRAAMLLAQERPAEAERLAWEAAAEFGREGRFDDEAWATAVLAQALLAQGKIPAARDALRPAEAHARRSENRGVRLLIAITAARCLAAAGDDETARQRLTAVIVKASERGLLGIELEARLALGFCELRAGEPAAGRERLRSLASEAQERGFGLIAARAAAAFATSQQQESVWTLALP